MTTTNHQSPLPTEQALAATLYTPIQIISTHRKRLSDIMKDWGPVTQNGQAIISSYLFLDLCNDKPPGWFWSMTGVVRKLPTRVSTQDITLMQLAYYNFEQRAKHPGFLAKHTLELKTRDGHLLAVVKFFNRNLHVRCN